MNKINNIKIEWQRLIIEEETCPRCGGTEEELEEAVKSLKDQGINVELIKKEINKEDFEKNPQESNRIIINGHPLEYWLKAEVGKSPCCSSCGDNECRTVEFEERTYETIPADLIVRAGKKAVEK